MNSIFCIQMFALSPKFYFHSWQYWLVFHLYGVGGGGVGCNTVHEMICRRLYTPFDSHVEGYGEIIHFCLTLNVVELTYTLSTIICFRLAQLLVLFVIFRIHTHLILLWTSTMTPDIVFVSQFHTI